MCEVSAYMCVYVCVYACARLSVYVCEFLSYVTMIKCFIPLNMFFPIKILSWLNAEIFLVFVYLYFLALLRKILVENASKRANLAQIKKHSWFTKNLKTKGQYRYHCLFLIIACPGNSLSVSKLLLKLILKMPNQGLNQDLETGCPNLAIVRFFSILFFKGHHDVLRFQPQTCIYLSK